MTSNREAIDTVVDSIVQLLLEYDHATASRKWDISRCLTHLYREHARLTGLSPSSPYAADQLRSAAGALRKLRDQTEEITSGLTTATKVVAAINSVLDLIP